jgi:hypothetical protein
VSSVSRQERACEATPVTKILAILLLSACMVSISAGEDARAPAEKIKSVLRSYANTLGCVVRFEDENILPYDVDDDGKKEFVVLVGIDPGCSGGTAMHRSVLVVLERETQGQIFVRPQQSFPSAQLEGFVQHMERISIKDEQLWYEGKEFDWTNDARCCPSVPVKARIFFKDGAWMDSRGH